MLTAEGIYKRYGRREVLKGLDLSVAPGTCAGIIGGNGCGKTTLLSILAGTSKANKGRVCLDNKTLRRNSKAYGEAVAYVPQENPLIGELTVRDNLLLWYKGDKKAMTEDLETGAGALLGVKPMLTRTVDKLSGGMKKRISIACALAGHGRYLILDEPGAALDMECKADIRRYLKTYMAAGGAVILTSHEIAELSICTQLYVLRNGRLEEIINHLSEQEFIGLMQK
ncbi:MAG: ATP-binding cassette domain-containing protein [Hungatella sp.]|nr:ATP-binding cassette domain-containing protein [Hungatella sp.]